MTSKYRWAAIVAIVFGTSTGASARAQYGWGG